MFTLIKQIAIHCLCLFGILSSNLSGEERLVFKTGFEPGLEIIKHPQYQQNHTFTGKDETTGFDFEEFAQQLDVVRFAYVIGGRRQDPASHVNTALKEGRGRDSSRGLLMEVVEDFKGDEENTRSELSLFPKNDDNALFARQGYARYWMKFDDDLAQGWPVNWINMFEVKEQHVEGRENYRFNFRVHKNPGDEAPQWGMVVHNYFDDDYEVVKRNREVQVPIGEWFKVEAFWKRDAGNGRLFLAINGEIVFDYRGRTQHPTNPQPVRFWSPLKNYRHRDWHDGDRTVKVWYDDLELWTGFPPSKERSE